MTRAQLIEIIGRLTSRPVDSQLEMPVTLGGLLNVLGWVGIFENEDPLKLRRQCETCTRKIHSMGARFCVQCGTALPPVAPDESGG